MKRWLAVASVAVVVVAGFWGAVELLQNRRFAAPYPPLLAVQDPAVIARGRYLVTSPAHCAFCHTPNDQFHALQHGASVAMIGDHVWQTPIGKIYSRNLTSDAETGLGAYTDGEIARCLRYGVGRDGQALMPFMAFQNLSDQDLTAVISYLRTLPPVRHRTRRHQFTFVGKIVKAFVLKPQGPKGTPAVSVAEGPTAAYGHYLAHQVANCAGCHSVRNLLTGEITGAPFAGGVEMPSEVRPGLVFVTPNLTPDPETGRLAHWTEASYIARFRAGALMPDSPMPWGAFQRMSDDDLRAIYRYERQLRPVHHPTGPSIKTGPV